MGALGYVMHVPEEEKFLNTQKELEAMLVGYLGGRAAEEIVFDLSLIHIYARLQEKKNELAKKPGKDNPQRGVELA